MRLNNIFTDDEAVSPVIGVILMVAITVILAAVIGAFVLGIGANQETVPQATFSFDYDTTDNGEVTITHDGGDNIDSARLTVKAQGFTADGSFSGTVSSGSTATVTTDAAVGAGNGMEAGNKVSVVWEASSGDQSQTLGSIDIPTDSDNAP